MNLLEQHKLLKTSVVKFPVSVSLWPIAKKKKFQTEHRIQSTPVENRRSINKCTFEDWSKAEWCLIESHSLNQFEIIKMIDSPLCRIIYYLSVRNTIIY